MRLTPCRYHVYRYHHASITVGGDIIVHGGFDGTPLEDTWQYAPASNKWCECRTKPARSADSFPRRPASVTELPVGSGRTQLRPANSKAENPGPASRYGSLMVPIAGGLVLYGGSEQTAADGEILGDLWCYTYAAEEDTVMTVNGAPGCFPGQ